MIYQSLCLLSLIKNHTQKRKQEAICRLRGRKCGLKTIFGVRRPIFEPCVYLGSQKSISLLCPHLITVNPHHYTREPFIIQLNTQLNTRRLINKNQCLKHHVIIYIFVQVWVGLLVSSMLTSAVLIVTDVIVGNESSDKYKICSASFSSDNNNVYRHLSKFIILTSRIMWKQGEGG